MAAQKKHPSVRARANKASTAATLSAKPAPVSTQNYAGLTVAQLRGEIDRRNGDGRPETAHLPKRGAKAVLVAALTADDDPTPRLPSHPSGSWHPLTVEMWEDIWASPMSAEWDESDLHNVYILAAIYDDIWRADTATARAKAAGEYRLQRAELGLSPYSRRRLEWTIESAEDAKARGQQRRRSGTPAPAGAAKDDRPDPRAGLHAVS